MRIYPHLQDSGGFFVAVIQRSPTSRPSTSSKANDTPSVTSRPETDQPPANSSTPSSTLSAAQLQKSRQSQLVDESSETAEPAAKKPRIASPARQSVTGESEVAQANDVAADWDMNLKEMIPETSEGIVGETGGQFKEDPYTFLPPDDPLLSSCM
jgi:multisite-specific tRNA:(cytosine-C5)-methyltransferase